MSEITIPHHYDPELYKDAPVREIDEAFLREIGATEECINMHRLADEGLFQGCCIGGVEPEHPADKDEP